MIYDLYMFLRNQKSICTQFLNVREAREEYHLDKIHQEQGTHEEVWDVNEQTAQT